MFAYSSIRPSDLWFRWLLVPALVFLAMATSQTHLADFWHHLARGRDIALSGRLLDHEVFTFTIAGQSFQDVNWLTQLGYFYLFQIGGLDLVRVVNALLLCAVFVWLMVLCRRQTQNLAIAMGLGLACFLGLWEVLTIRPQTLSLLLFVAMVDLLDRSEKSPWLLGVVPLMMALWANLHGAFPAGLILIGCFWLAQTGTWWYERTPAARTHWYTLTLTLAASGLATLINPYGWGIYQYVGLTSRRAGERRLDEWLPPSLDQMIGLAWFLSLPILVGLLWLGWKKYRVPLRIREVVLLGCFGLMALSSVRMVAWWLLILAPILAGRLEKIWPADPAQTFPPNRGAVLSCLGLVVIMILSLPALHHLNPLLQLRPKDRTTSHLEQARQYLQDQVPSAQVFARFEWGEYLAWAGHSHSKIFMDGRIEIYPDSVWNDYASITRGDPDWEKILDRWRVDVLLLDADFHRKSGLLSRVESSSQWQLRYQSGNALVWQRPHGAGF